MFWQLASIRRHDMGSPEPIQPKDILDWCALTGNVVSRNESSIILAMDIAYRNAWQDESARAAAARKPGGGS